MNKLTVQCQGGTGNALEYNRVVRPAAIKAINVSDAGFWARARGDNPGGLRVLRRYPNFEGWDVRPEVAAREAVKAYGDEYGHLLGNGLVTHVEDNNEWVHAFDCAGFEAADRFMATFVAEVHQKWRGEVHVVALNAACGHFSDVRWEHCDNRIGVFGRTLRLLNECPECMLGTHEYDWPTMWRLYEEGLGKGDGGMWLCLKFLRIQRWFEEHGLGNVRQAITEAGLDSGAAHQYPNRGWRAMGQEIGEARRLYLRHLRWVYDAVMRQPRLVFVALFGYGLDGDWGSFNLDYETVQAIAGFRLYPEVQG